jgi:hypothetical protein
MQDRYHRLQKPLAKRSQRMAMANVKESWSDATAEKFMQENFLDTEGTFTRLIASLQEAAELVRSIEKRVGDGEI